MLGPLSAEVAPSLANFGPEPMDFGQFWADVVLGRIRPMSGKFAKSEQNLPGLGPISFEIGTSSIE